MLLKDIQQAFQKLKMQVNTHLGNPAAHPLVKWDYSGAAKGFVNQDTVMAANRVPKYITKGTDVFTLTPGFYKGDGSLKNIPAEATTGTNYIEVVGNAATEDTMYGRIKLNNATSQKNFVAYKQGWNKGKYHWLRYDKHQNFRGKWVTSGSYYSIYHLDTTTLFSAYINANVSLSPHNGVSIVTQLPGSFRPDRVIYTLGQAETNSGVWVAAGIALLPTGLLRVINLSDQSIHRTHGEMVFTYNEGANVGLK